jgi:hypothetical protein
MLTIEYEQSLVETTVFLAVRNNERLECDLHQVIDRLYEIPDEELMQREFVPVFREFFTKLRFDRLVAELLAERPLVGEFVDRCVVREAPRKKAQSAELLVQGNNSDDGRAARTLVIQICPQSFIDTGDTAVSDPLRGRLVTLMRRELLHVADMLDERFGYVREVFSGEPSRQNLHRDRYRVLWDTYVAGRLEREKFGVNEEKERLERAFGRVFANHAAGIDAGVFARIFDAPSLTHRNFMEWSREPNLLCDSLPDASQVPANTA